MALRSRNAVTLFKIEVTPGVDAAPVAASDAVEIENFRISPAPNQIVTAEDNGSLDGAGAIAGGMTVGLSFDCLLKGSGAAATAPQWGKILRACGWAELITSTAVPAAPEACAAGGSTTLAVLGASASSSVGAYDGMPVNFTGVVALSTFIGLYAAAKNASLVETAGGAIIATTSYQVPINVRYAPISASIPSLTVYRYQDGKLWKILGVRGTMTLAVDAGGIGRMSFRMTGIAAAAFESDAAVPSPTLDTTRPPPWLGGRMRFNRIAYGVSRLTFDNGVGSTYPPNPEATEGVDVPELVARRATGGIDPNEVLVGTADLMTDMRAGTKRILHARAGSVAGNRWGFTVPEALMLNKEPGDRQGIQISGVPFECTGRDRFAFLTIY